MLFFATTRLPWYLFPEMYNLAFITNFLSGGDGIIILVIVLIIFGPKKLPELARGMGQAIREFQKAKDEVTRELTSVPEVVVQPAPGQQPRQAEVLPPAPAAVAPSPVAASPAAVAPAPAPQVVATVEETHPAGQV